jgi:hypothetical protein
MPAIFVKKQKLSSQEEDDEKDYETLLDEKSSSEQMLGKVSKNSPNGKYLLYKLQIHGGKS